MRIEDHPMKMIMDLSHLIKRAMEQQMADLEISSIQSRVLGFLWWKAWKKEPVFQKELEQRAAEKKRVLDAAATFAKATVTEGIAEKKEALAQKVQSLDLESIRLQELQEQLKNRMAENAEWFLTHNPGSRFMTAKGETRSAEIRELIQKLRLKRQQEKQHK